MSVVAILRDRYKLTTGEADLLVKRIGELPIENMMLSGNTGRLFREMIVVKRLAAEMHKQGLTPDASGIADFNSLISPTTCDDNQLGSAINTFLKTKV